MSNLQKKYNEWRKEIEEENEWQKEHGGSHPLYSEYDCGSDAARESFSEYAGLNYEISFKDMLKLERNYR